MWILRDSCVRRDVQEHLGFFRFSVKETVFHWSQLPKEELFPPTPRNPAQSSVALPGPLAVPREASKALHWSFEVAGRV